MSDEAALAEAVERLGSEHSVDQLEDLLSAAEDAGDEQRAETIRRALLYLSQPDLESLIKNVGAYLIKREVWHTWSTWRDEGIVGIRLRAQPMALLSDPITYWVREGDDGLELMIDGHDAPTPTAFAQRTLQTFPGGQFGAKRVEHLIIAQLGP